jgi:hypothetical protein
MKIKEIIHESINLSTHRIDVMRTMSNAMVKLIKALGSQFSSNYFKPALSTQDSNVFLNKSIDLINRFLTTYTEDYLKNELSEIVTVILKTSEKIRVDFDDIDNDAEVDKFNNIIIHIKYSDVITEGIKENFSKIFTDTWDNTIGYNNIQSFIDTLPQNKENLYLLLGNKNHVNLVYIFNRLSTIFIHETVHVAQNLTHTDKVKQGLMKNPEYRSYLQKDMESFINQINNLKNDSSGFRLYKSSPQEITSMAHDIALNIIQKFKWDEYTDPTKIVIDPNEISLHVNDHLRNARIYPTTKTEKMIYKRYMKLIYSELVMYKNWLINSNKTK